MADRSDFVTWSFDTAPLASPSRPSSERRMGTSILAAKERSVAASASTESCSGPSDDDSNGNTAKSARRRRTSSSACSELSTAVKVAPSPKCSTAATWQNPPSGPANAMRAGRSSDDAHATLAEQLEDAVAAEHGADVVGRIVGAAVHARRVW